MAVNGLTEPTSSLQIENMSLELPNNDFGFQKHPDLETFNNGDQLMLLQSYSACRQDQPDRLMFELVVFLINMYFHRIAKNRAAFALLTHKSMCILSKSETQKLSELQDLMDSGLHFVTQNLFTKSQFEEAKLNISQKENWIQSFDKSRPLLSNIKMLNLCDPDSWRVYIQNVIQIIVEHPDFLDYV
ncbi:hypothetical protein RF11_03288 [Thelohanellus kitauei]|uniref:Uncharacterized protein n=1 Tax=Thelohanellus kitauei TaxID=669202 RepID=A0A0C2IKG4_THEKT|nr:hypothetical protein RF11_03288 [Thelohanellus kitauei]